MKILGFQQLGTLYARMSTRRMSAFGGATSELYEKAFRRNAPAWEAIVAAVPATSTSILDLASGPGEPARSLGLAFPDAKVVATDLEPAMVQKQATYIDLPNVESMLVDANDLSRFADRSFDAVTMCYGIMFVDRPRALAEIRRVLRPGGVLACTYWRRHVVTRLGLELLDRFGRGDLQSLMIDPESVAAPGILEADLAAAGFDTVFSDQQYDQTLGSDLDEAFWAAIIPFKTAVDQVECQSEQDDLMAKAKLEFATIAEARFQRGDEYVITDNASALAVATRKPDSV